MGRPSKEDKLDNFVGLKFATEDKNKLMNIAKDKGITLTALIKESIRQQLGVNIC